MILPLIRVLSEKRVLTEERFTVPFEKIYLAEFNEEEEAAVIVIQHMEWIIGSKQTVKEKPQTFWRKARRM